MTSLSQDEIQRYQRHLTLPGFGEAAQLKLREARVLVVGAGGLGCPALQYLAAAGVGVLGIVDDDRVARSNLQRQVLFTDANVGSPKAEVAAQRLRATNPTIRCRPHGVRLDVGNAMDLIGDYDLVIDGSDNFPTRYLVNDACVLADKPFIFGALETFRGQVSVFNHAGGPNYRCLFPEPPAAEDAPNCAEIGVLGALPGWIGTIQALEAIKVLTGVGEPLAGRLLLLDVLTMESRIVRFERVPERADVREIQTVDAVCGAGATSEAGSDEIGPGELRAWMDGDDGIQIIDVRESWERAICRIDSVHVPLDEVLEGRFNPGVAGLRPDAATCVYCKVGARGRKALEALRTHYGMPHVKNLRGGILAWATEVDPSLPTY